MEIMISLTIITILMASSAPSVIRIIEQAHCDMAAANLRSIKNAQRLYWLQNRQYAGDTATLQTAKLLDLSMLSSNRYDYEITSASSDTFTATAERKGSSVWSGTLTITEISDQVTGTVVGSGHTLVPAD